MYLCVNNFTRQYPACWQYYILSIIARRQWLHYFFRRATIVIRKYMEGIICGLSWVPEAISTQAMSEYIKCKYWLHRKIKTTVFVMWSDSLFFMWFFMWSVFLIGYAWWKLCNMWLLPIIDNSRSIKEYAGVTLDE